jgi:hypothetical protein
MKDDKEPSDAELVARYFATDDLSFFYGTDDPVEILARIDLEEIKCTGPSFRGDWKEEEEELERIVRIAKREHSLLEKKRVSGSLEFLAAKLNKSSRQVREYCKKGLVPGCYQTAGEHWRVRYREDTVELTRRAIGDSSRQRTSGWFIKYLRQQYRETPMEDWRDISLLPPHLLDLIKPPRYEYAAAAESLRLQGKEVTVRAIAQLTGHSPTTVRKYAPNVARGRRMAKGDNNPLIDQFNDEIDRKYNGKVWTGNIER